MRDLARSYRDFFATAGAESLRLRDIAWTSSTRRTAHEERLCIRCDSQPGLTDSLTQFLDDENSPEREAGRYVAQKDVKLAFVCSGQGSQWWGMGRELFEKEPVYRQTIEACDSLIRALGDWSLIEELSRPEADSRLERTAFAQPALFALQTALSRLLKSWGVVPDAVVGHSVGEIAASHISGRLSLEEAVKVVYHRASCMDFPGAAGGMLAAALLPDEAEELTSDCSVSVAAINGPGLVTLSGPVVELNAIADRLVEQGVFHRRLDVKYAFHNSCLDPIREHMISTLAGLRCSHEELPFYSTVTSHLFSDGDALDGSYWWRNIRYPVLFGPTIQHMLRDGYRIFLELSPHPVVGGAIRACCEDGSKPLEVLESLRRESDERAGLLSTLARLFTLGFDLDWTRIQPRSGKPIALPSYPWQRETFWSEPEPAMHFRLASVTHPLLGRRRRAREYCWQTRLHPDRPAYVRDHQLQGSILLPGSAYLEQALAVGREISEGKFFAVERLLIKNPCFLENALGVRLRALLDFPSRTLRISGKQKDTDDWVEHCRCKISSAAQDRPRALFDRTAATEDCLIQWGQEHCQRSLRASGYEVGPTFLGLRKLWVGRQDALGSIQAPRGISRDSHNYWAHPALLDACFQVAGFLLTNALQESSLFIPVEIQRARFWERLPDSFWCQAYLPDASARNLRTDLKIFGVDGRLIGMVEGLGFHSLQADGHLNLENCTYQYGWEELETTSGRRQRMRPWNQCTQEVASACEAAETRIQELGLGAACREYVDLAKTNETWDFNIREDFPGRFLPIHSQAAADVELLRHTLWGSADSPEWGQESVDRVSRNGSGEGVDALAQFSPPIRIRDLYSRELLSRVLRGSQRIRVLEVGACTGLAGGSGLPLHSPNVEFVLTDCSSQRLARLRDRCKPSPRIAVRALDLQQPPREQGFIHGQFDLVLVAEEGALKPDFEKSLHHLNWLLAPEADLLLFGLASLPSFFESLYGNRELGQLLPTPLREDRDWQTLLDQAGFSNWVVDVLRADNPRVTLGRARKHRPVNAVLDREPALHKAESGTPHRRWVLLLDRRGFGRQLARSLSDRGQEVIEIESSDGRRDPGGDPLRQRLEESAGKQTDPIYGVLDLRALDVPSPHQKSRERVPEAALQACLALSELATLILPHEGQPLPYLCVVTQQTQVVDSAGFGVNLSQAPVVSLARVVAGEFPATRVVRVDVSSLDSQAEIRTLVNTILSDLDEDELAIREERLLALRYRHFDGRPRCSATDPAPGRNGDFRLAPASASASGQLDVWRTAKRVPGPGEVEVQVECCALNFSDVMLNLGIYPGAKGSAVPLGLEFSGVIRRVGPGVDHLKTGMRVVGLAHSAMASVVTTSAKQVCALPTDWNMAQAATIPAAFLTAHIALCHYGRLRQGERVLIHSATGGVGLSALQIARGCQAEVFATAGNRVKRNYLRALGVESVFDSRTLDFADRIQDITGGEGVDVVLNSLSGEAISKGLEVLRVDGRFLELGKRDIYQDSQVGLFPFSKRLSFTAIDLDGMARNDPELVARTFRQVMQRIEDGTYSPLPFRAIPIDAAQSAFRAMSKARHIGKLVLTREPGIVPREGAEKAMIRSNGGYLITGGMGGLGIALARRLISQGARRVGLLGRRNPSPEVQRELDQLASCGADVRVFQADVTCRDDLQRVLREFSNDLFPLKGIFHAAGVLEDCVVANLTESRFRRIWGAKAEGAWNLHCLTLDLDLDYFVLFSSAATFLGNPGQAAYSAANGFMDALAEYRQASGKPGLSIGWGMIDEVGMAVRIPGLRKLAKDRGIRPIPPARAMDLLIRLLEARISYAAVLDMDILRWQNWKGIQLPARFRAIVPTADNSRDDSKESSARVKLSQASPQELSSLLQSLLRAQLGRILGSTAEEIDLQTPVTHLGLDSLMGIELQNWIEAELGLRLPAVGLLKGPTVTQLSSSLLEQLSDRRLQIPEEPISAHADGPDASRPLQAPAPTHAMETPPEERDENATELRVSQ